MPSSKFIIKNDISTTFRAEKIKGMFDCDINEWVKEFDVHIPIENKKWNVGLIVGGSGTGKTTIAKKMFKDFHLFESFDWKKSSFLDDFNSNLSVKDIVECLSKVGFSSPKDWLKPYHTLSNGQKMRVDLARLMMEQDKPFIFDEFTSVVDRQVACITSSAISKYIKKNDKQFIAVSCHKDINEWLEPDWIYDVDTHTFQWSCLRRPSIKCVIRKADRSEWKEFMEFHYLSHALAPSATNYICEINNIKVGFCSIMHFPHPTVKNIKRIHRIVIKPDYQGIGLGKMFLTEISSFYKNKGYRVRLVTSIPSFIFGLKNSKKWILNKMGKSIPHTGSLKFKNEKYRLVASFEFVA